MKNLWDIYTDRERPKMFLNCVLKHRTIPTVERGVTTTEIAHKWVQLFTDGIATTPQHSAGREGEFISL